MPTKKKSEYISSCNVSCYSGGNSVYGELLFCSPNHSGWKNGAGGWSCACDPRVLGKADITMFMWVYALGRAGEAGGLEGFIFSLSRHLGSLKVETSVYRHILWWSVSAPSPVLSRPLSPFHLVLAWNPVIPCPGPSQHVALTSDLVGAFSLSAKKDRGDGYTSGFSSQRI